MSIFLDIPKLSVKCHRKKHEACKNQNGTCGCSCHRLVELQRKFDECFKNDKSHTEALAY